MKTLFQNVTVVVMDDRKTVLKDAYVAVDGSKITAVDEKRPVGFFDAVIHGAGKVLMPGFVNAHTHLPMTLLRGYGGGHNLQDWLNDYIFPAEAKLDDRCIAAGTALGLAEMIASGVTCIADMYDHCDTIIQEVAAAGLSANIARGTTVFTDDYDFATFPACRELRELVERWHGYKDGQILIDACIHGEYTSRERFWRDLADYAKAQDLGMHVHISETLTEHEECKHRHNGLTPVQILDQCGVWDTRAIAAHCVHTTPEDWAILAQKGVSCIHNPTSNLKLGSGIAPITAMRKAGVNVGLGTDGVSSNNSTDLFFDLKLAAILHNGATRDPQALSAYDALQMATVNGAKALGRNTGRVEVGCDADLVLVDFDRPNTIPCHDVIENLVYSANSSNVSLTMCRGKILYQNGEFFTIDLDKVKKEVADYAIPKLFG